MAGEWAGARPQAGSRALVGRVVLGVDPGTRVVGWGALLLTASGPQLIAAGVLRPDLKLDVPGRLAAIRVGLDRLLADQRPAVVVVEQAFASRNLQSALRIGEGRGVVLSCAAATGAEVVQYPPAVAKKAIVGNGQAHKTQVAAMVARLLRLAEPPEPLDATDALALALAHLVRGASPLAALRSAPRRRLLPESVARRIVAPAPRR